MDPMGSAGEAMNSAQTVIVQTPGAPSFLPTSDGAAQFAAALFQSPTAFAGMRPPFLGTPSADIFLPGAYPRPLDPTAYPLPYPYNMAIAKGSSFDSDNGSAIKKPRTVFTPKQLLHLEEEFVKNQFPNMEQRKQIAKDLDLTQQHIQIWFQNRRAKKRRKKKRHSEEEKMRRDPKPPSFWPSNLPFSSNIGDLARKVPSEETASKSAADTKSTNDAVSSNDRESLHTKAVPSTEPQQYYAPLPTSTLNTERSNTSSTTRLSRLHCNTQEPPLKSPTLALTAGNGHSQLPTPPPHVSPVTSLPATGNFVGSSIVSIMSHSSTEVVLAPPGDIGLQNYPPLPPPDSLLAGSFHEPGGYMCDSPSLHSLHVRSITHTIPPPPYSFGAKLSSSDTVLSSPLLYTMDHVPTGSIAFIDSLNASNGPHSKPFPPSSETAVSSLAGVGPSSGSPTLSPIANSDGSLAEASPLATDVALAAEPTTSGQPGALSLRNEGGSSLSSPLIASHSVSSPIHATDPVALTDIHDKEWEDVFSNSLCPVIQTDPIMWAASPSPMLANSATSSKARSRASDTGMSSQRYAAIDSVGYFPQYSSGNAGSNPVSSISNGAK